MRDGLIVRDFAAGDVAPANELTNHYIRETTIHFGATEASDGDFAAVWEKGRGRFPWLAAERDGRFAGYAKAGVWRERDAYARTVETGIYVARDLQGTGVGRALYLSLLARLRDAGFHAAVAGITLPNTPSVRLHESVGFTPVGVFREVGRKFDAWHDVGFWQVML